MKKRYLFTTIVLAITLAGCSTPAPASNNQSADTASTKETVFDAEIKAEIEQAEAEEAEKEAAKSQRTLSSPIYKVITKYYSKYYDGSLKEDAEGNSLENKELYSGKAQALMLSDSSKESFPELYEALKESADNVLNSAQSAADTAAATAKDDLESSVSGGYSFFGPYSDTNKISISRADDKVISFCSNYTAFSGGAHGIYGLEGTTYNVDTGEFIFLDDVITLTEDELNQILIKKILETSTDPDQFWDLEETLSHYKYNPSETDPNNSDNYEYAYIWYLDYTGIHFYFGPYAIAAYAYGPTDVVIGYDELDGVINENYLPGDFKGFVSEAPLPVYSKEWDDDTSDLHLVIEKEDPNSEDSVCKSISLMEKTKSATADIYFDYSSDVLSTVTPYQVVTSDNKEFIYVTVLGMSDYTELLVFSVSDDDIKLVGRENFHMVYLDQDSGYAGEMVLTDPNDLHFGKVGDKLGTYTCFAKYKVGPDGMPVMVDKDFTISWTSDDIKSKKEIKATIVDEDGKELSEETLPAGTHVKPVRTDNSKYVDCNLDDGRIVRFKISNGTVPAEIDGVSVDDLFDGLQYAG